jgi:hypothetical protein
MVKRKAESIEDFRKRIREYYHNHREQYKIYSHRHWLKHKEQMSMHTLFTALTRLFEKIKVFLSFENENSFSEKDEPTNRFAFVGFRSLFSFSNFSFTSLNAFAISKNYLGIYLNTENFFESIFSIDFLKKEVAVNDL